MEEEKRCVACGEKIKGVAKRCPHCHTWQSKWRVEPNDPRYGIVVMIFLVAFVVLAFGSLFTRMGLVGKVNFQDYASKLPVIESKINHGEDRSGHFVSVVGRIRNDTEITWERVFFEVQYYDADNKLIDSTSGSIDDIVLPPRKETSFKVRGKADKQESDYKSAKIILKKAKEADKWF